MKVASLALGTLLYWVAFVLVLVSVLQETSGSPLAVTLGFLAFPLYAVTTWGYISLLRGSTTVQETSERRWVICLCVLALFAQTAFLLTRPDRPSGRSGTVPP